MKAIELDLDNASLRAALPSKQLNQKPTAFVVANNHQNLPVAEEQAVKLVRRINDIPNINNCFRSINLILEEQGTLDGYFQDCNAVSSDQKWNIPLFHSCIRIIDFLLHRVAPKTRFFDLMHLIITKGKNKRISKAEVLGRLIYCGFEILSTHEVNGKVYFKAQKKSAPMPLQKVSGGWIYAMPRIGKKGKIIHVYKFRTMHPYSEFLQTFLKEKHGYDQTGKIKDDFRVTTWGKFFRKYWIDEIPQLINLFRGELKLVGFRPVSAAYFKDLPNELKAMRLQHKPGCIPPYVALNRKSSVEGVLDAEREYLEFCSKHRFADLCFFFAALYHIIITGKRSA